MQRTKKPPFDLGIVHCGELLTVSGATEQPKRRKVLSDVGRIEKGAIGISAGKIAWVGRQASYRRSYHARREIDAGGKVVMPGMVDPHTHAVFAGSREDEWSEKIAGTPYLEILKKGGGILKTVSATRAASSNRLFQNAQAILKKMLAYGTTTVEIKSGYGLNPQQERKLLKVIARLKKETPLDVVATYLGAHAIPREYLENPEAYVDEVLNSLRSVKPLATFCDLFCEAGAFSYEQSKRILEGARQAGFQIKLHAGQFSDQGGVRLAAAFKAASVDHLDVMQSKDISALAESGTIAVLLPGVSHFLGSSHHAPARALIEGNVPVALATDFNPGTSPCLSMQEILHLAVRNLKMSPGEAISAATINAAHAIGLAGELGSIEAGKKADLLLLDIHNHRQLPYFFGVNHVRTVIKNGEVVYSKNGS